MMEKQIEQQEGNDQHLAGVETDKVVQFLTFKLNEEEYGVSILNIKEIVDYGHVTKVPMMTDFIAGVINLRGSVVPVVDLALRFSKIPSIRTKRSSIVILEIEHESKKIEIGITVDVVDEVLDIVPNEIEVTPSFGTKIRTDFISGMGKVDGQLLVLLNIEKILDIEELSAVEEQ